MKKAIILCMMLLMLFTACSRSPVPELERCSLCEDLARHAPCIINLSTGKKVELDVYEPHPFLVGEIAEEQRGGYFSFVRGAGVEGYKLGAESITVTIPTRNAELEKKYFCNTCQQLLDNYEKEGYALVDLKDTKHPVLYPIVDGASLSFRCYEVFMERLDESSEYQITVIGTYESSDDDNK